MKDTLTGDDTSTGALAGATMESTLKHERLPMEPEAVATLYYHHAGPEQLMADLEKLIQGVPVGRIVRVFTPSPETWEQLQAWCATRNYGIVRRTDEYACWVGAPSYKTGWDIVDIEVR